MIAVTTRRSVVELDPDYRASFKDGVVTIDWQLELHLFLKIAGVTIE